MQFLLSHCQAALSQHGGILLTLFLAGLVGGLAHCAGMCGPFVIAQVGHGSAEHAAKNTILRKLSGAALLPYHFGRMTTYILLGAVAAALSRQIIGTTLQKDIAFVFLSVAGILFLASALPEIRLWPTFLSGKRFLKIEAVLGRLSRPLFARPTNLRRYGLGVLLGFLPCSLVFASLMVVSTTGDIVTAILAMSLFTLGTFPSMFLVGIGSGLACKRWPDGMRTVARAVMIFNGFSLFFLAGNLVL